jgi:circadian clock protein KaiB
MAADKVARTKVRARTEEYVLRLYVTENSSQSITALRNLKSLCEEHLCGHYRIDVVDLLKNPQRAREDQIVAVPTLVRKMPAPLRKIIGNLSNTERVLLGLDLYPPEREPKGEQDVT